MADNPNAHFHEKYRELVIKCEAHPQLHNFVRNIPGKNYQNFDNEAFVLANAHTLESINMINALDNMENVWEMVILAAENLYMQLEVLQEEADAKATAGE